MLMKSTPGVKLLAKITDVPALIVLQFTLHYSVSTTKLHPTLSIKTALS